MAILKWQRGVNDWVPLYGAALRNRLRRDKNLSDLTNVTEAKKNLGLYGNVEDHNHDSRYLPMIERIDGKVDSEVQARQISEKNMADDLRARAEAAVNAAVEAFGVSIAREAAERKKADEGLEKTITNVKTSLQTDLSQETSDRMSDKQDLINRIDTERSDRTIAIGQEVKDRDAAIKKATDLLDQEIKDRQDAITQEVRDRNDAIDTKATEIKGWITAEAVARDKAVATAKNDVTTLVNNEAAARLANKQDLDNMDQYILALIDKKYQDLVNMINKGIGNYYVGETPPENPTDRQTLWFNCKDGNEELRIFKDKRWVLFGAGYL